MNAKAYRFEDRRYANMPDEFHDYTGSTLRVECFEYDVLSMTPTGFWISYGLGKRFVRRDAKRKFACLAKADALASFRARKQAQIRILKAQLESAQHALELVRHEKP